MPVFYKKKILCWLIFVTSFLIAITGVVSAQSPPILNFGDNKGYFYNCNFSDSLPAFHFSLYNQTAEEDKNRIASYQINWGDGQKETVHNKDFPLNHLYSQGNFHLQVLVTYDDSLQYSTSYMIQNSEQNSPFPIAEAGSDAEICEDGTYTISGAAVKNYSEYMWETTGLGALVNTNSLTPTYAALSEEAGEIYLILTVQGSTPCLSATDSMKIAIIPHPTIDAGSDDEVCSNEIYHLNIGGEEGQISAGSWSEIIHSSTGNGFFAGIDGLSAFYVPGSEDKINKNVSIRLHANGINPPCNDFVTDQMSLAITTEPFVNAGVDAAICEGQNVQLSTSYASEYASLLWKTSIPGGGIFDDPTSLHPVYTPNNGKTGKWSLFVEAKGNGSCQSVADGMELNIVPLPWVSAGPDSVSCGDQGFILTGAQAKSYSTINWTSSGSGTFENNSVLHARYIPSTRDLEKGYVRLTATAQGKTPCIATATDNMVLSFSHPLFVEAGRNDTICLEDELYKVKLKSATYPFGADTSHVTSISWSTTGSGELSEEASLTPTYRFAPDETGTVKLILTGYRGNTCHKSDTLELIIISSPLPDFQILPNSIGCSPLNRGIYNISKGNPDYYLFNFGDSTAYGYRAKSVEHPFEHRFTANDKKTIYTIRLTAGNTCGERSLEKDITVYPKAVEAIMSASETEGCVPFTVEFENLSKGNSDYLKTEWSFEPDSPPWQGTGSDSAVHTFENAGTYQVRLVVNDTCSFDTTYQTIVVNKAAPLKFEIKSHGYCEKEAIEFVVPPDVVQNYMHFEWNFGDSVYSKNSQYVHKFTEAGKYTVKLTAVDIQHGCENGVIQQLNIYSLPEIGFELSDSSICAGEEIHFKDTSLNRKFTFWSFGNGITSSKQQTSHTYFKAGRYNLELKVTEENGCSDSISLKDFLTVYPKPLAGFTFQNTNLWEEDIKLQNSHITSNHGYVQFFNLSQKGNIPEWATDTSLVYLWNFNDNSFSKEIHPLHQFSNNGSFFVNLLASNTWGCYDSHSQNVAVDLMSSLFIPSAFAPGNANDQVSRFIPKGIGLSEYEIEIYDTWGNLLWQSNKILEGRPAEYWDGYYQGRLMPQGAYLWKARATFLNGMPWIGMKIGKKHYLQGTVTLIR